MSRILTLKSILEKEPGDTFSKYALALEYVSCGETEKAEEIFIDLTNNNPDYVAAYYQYGKLLEDKAETESARKIYNQGIFVATSQNDLHTRSELQDAMDNLF
ncbi:hypothetical protein BH10BAC5_BH10BAC5_24050 [soil metagenome]